MSEIQKVFYPQDPDDKLDYDFDYTDFCGATDTIASNTVTVKPTGELTIVTTTATTLKVKAWLQGGSVGKDYTVECQVTTALGRKKSLYLIIQVRQP